MSKNEIYPLAYKIEELTELDGISRGSHYKAIRLGHLRARKAGGRTVVLRSDYLEWLTSLPSMTSRGKASA